MDNPPEVVAVTGAAGYIGARLLQELQRQPSLGRVVAFDLKPLTLSQEEILSFGSAQDRPNPPLAKGGTDPTLPSPPLPRSGEEGVEGISEEQQPGSAPPVILYQQDLTAPIDNALGRHQVTTLVHLAHIIRPGRNRREIYRVRQTNLKMLGTVLESCTQAGVRHIIYLSSHTVYGAHRDNPIPLTEGSPLRALPGFPYGYDKFLAEQALREFAERHPDIKVTILRCCVVLGAEANNYITQAFFRPLLLAIKGYNPPLQFLHEDDLARILTTVIQRGTPGVFNVAGEGLVHYREVVERAGSKLVSLPAFLAYPLVQLVWGLGIQRDAPSAGLNLIRYPIVVSTENLKKAIGYQFHYTSREALVAFAEARAKSPVRRKAEAPPKL